MIQWLCLILASTRLLQDAESVPVSDNLKYSSSGYEKEESASGFPDGADINDIKPGSVTHPVHGIGLNISSEFLTLPEVSTNYEFEVPDARKVITESIADGITDKLTGTSRTMDGEDTEEVFEKRAFNESAKMSSDSSMSNDSASYGNETKAETLAQRWENSEQDLERETTVKNQNLEAAGDRVVVKNGGHSATNILGQHMANQVKNYEQEQSNSSQNLARVESKNSTNFGDGNTAKVNPQNMAQIGQQDGMIKTNENPKIKSENVTKDIVYHDTKDTSAVDDGDLDEDVTFQTLDKDQSSHQKDDIANTSHESSEFEAAADDNGNSKGDSGPTPDPRSKSMSNEDEKSLEYTNEDDNRKADDETVGSKRERLGTSSDLSNNFGSGQINIDDETSSGTNEKELEEDSGNFTDHDAIPVEMDAEMDGQDNEDDMSKRSIDDGLDFPEYSLVMDPHAVNEDLEGNEDEFNYDDEDNEDSNESIKDNVN